MKLYVKSAIGNLLDEDLDSRKTTARENLSDDALELMSKDTNQYVRVGVAENPNTSPELLTKLANDRSNKVRIAVAGNPNTPPEVLRKIRETNGYGNFNRKHPIDARFVVALLKNNNTPIDYRKKLIDLAYYGIASMGWVSPDHYRRHYGDPILAIVKDPQAPIEIIKYILQLEIKDSSNILKLALKRIYGE